MARYHGKFWNGVEPPSGLVWFFAECQDYAVQALCYRLVVGAQIESSTDSRRIGPIAQLG